MRPSFEHKGGNKAVQDIVALSKGVFQSFNV